jgi:hypothetical protein
MGVTTTRMTRCRRPRHTPEMLRLCRFVPCLGAYVCIPELPRLGCAQLSRALSPLVRTRCSLRVLEASSILWFITCRHRSAHSRAGWPMEDVGFTFTLDLPKASHYTNNRLKIRKKKIIAENVFYLFLRASVATVFRFIAYKISCEV